MSIDSESVSLISFELASIDVSFGMPESSFAFGFVADPFAFVDSSIDPFLDAVSASHFATLGGLAPILVNEHLALIHRSIRKHIVIYKYQPLNIIFEFWHQIIIGLLESIVLVYRAIGIISVVVFIISLGSKNG